MKASPREHDREPSHEANAFVRAKGGLCNKLRVVLSYREAEVVDGGKHLVVVWVINDECPARFDELFEPLDDVTFLCSDDPQLDEKLRALGSPEGVSMKRDMRTHPAIAALESASSTGSRDQWMARREALMFLLLKPKPAIAERIAQCIARCGGKGAYAAVHVRRTDHVTLWGISTPDAEFFKFLDGKRSSGEERIYVATDNAGTQQLFSERFGADVTVTLAAIDPTATALRHTTVADAVVDLFVCADARAFKGTRGSSFSDAIWLLRRAGATAGGSDELHTARQLRRRRWREQRAAALGAAKSIGSVGATSVNNEEEDDDDPLKLSTYARDAGLPTLHAVVAYYRWRSYESLIEMLGCTDAHVYNKSPSGDVAPSSPRAGQARYHEVCVPNVGRESETYLRHICRHYDTLPEYVIFLQDDTHIHVPAHHAPAFCEQVRRAMLSRGLGQVMQVVHRGKRLYPPRVIDARDKMFPKLKRVCEKFGIAIPASYETNVCAFLLVSREAIRRRPLSFYERLLAWHADSLSVANRRGATEEELAPWLLEHLWQLIFFGDDGQVGSRDVGQDDDGDEVVVNVPLHDEADEAFEEAAFGPAVD